MLSLVYLTGVAGLIATSAVLHHIPLSRCSQTLLPPTSEVAPAPLQTSDLNPEAPPVAQHLPCCVLANCQTTSLGPDQYHTQNVPSASSQTSLLYLWSSLLASVGHIHPETDSEMDASQMGSPASFSCPSRLAPRPPFHCAFRNVSVLPTHSPLDNQQRHAPWLASTPPGGMEPSMNSCVQVIPPIQLKPCHADSLLPIDKAQALLMPG